jgi:hypothetical protein
MIVLVPLRVLLHKGSFDSADRFASEAVCGAQDANTLQ